MARHARITGKVEYREGDGTSLTIPQGPCEIDETLFDVTLSWVDGETHGSAAMPVSDFRRYVNMRAIELEPQAA